MLYCSEVFCRLAKGNTRVVNYEINVHTYNNTYYLADGIYSHSSTLVKTTHAPEEEKEKMFPK
jgi:hypothetical protein